MEGRAGAVRLNRPVDLDPMEPPAAKAGPFPVTAPF